MDYRWSGPELFRFRRRWCVVASILFFSAMVALSHAQVRDVVCDQGDSSFDASFRTNVTLHVGAARSGELATRTCAGTLSWGKQQLTVATGASQLDVDALGVDLGFGVPVVALQVRKAAAECCMTYQIYSLETPPHLLRSITGGDFFSASDRNLDGNVAIWTADAAAVNGLENLALGELDFPPTVILRFSHGLLLDVTSEFQGYFDNQIASIKRTLASQDLQDFRSSDGKLTPASSLSAERLHQLRTAKVKVLEIVWSYLYSGREQEAWHSLNEMWPAADVDRVRTEIANARAHGIHAQTDGASSGTGGGHRKHAYVFDVENRLESSRRLEVVPPEPILLRRPPLLQAQGQALPEAELFVELVIDSAGKVRSAEPVGKVKWVDTDLMSAALNWKFIPAFKDGRPVASRLRLAVSTKR